MNQTMKDFNDTVKEEAGQLARQFFGDDIKKCAGFIDRLIDICSRARGKDFLLIHNPGGWGHTPLEHSLQWESTPFPSAEVFPFLFTWQYS